MAWFAHLIQETIWHLRIASSQLEGCIYATMIANNTSKTGKNCHSFAFIYGSKLNYVN